MAPPRRVFTPEDMLQTLREKSQTTPVQPIAQPTEDTARISGQTPRRVFKPEDMLASLRTSTTTPAQQQPQEIEEPGVRSAEDVKSELALRNLEGVLPDLGIEHELEFYDKVRGIKDPVEQDRVYKKGQAAIARRNAVRRAAGMRASVEMERGRVEAAERARRGLDDMSVPPGLRGHAKMSLSEQQRAQGQRMTEAAKVPVQALGGLLDLSGWLRRKATTAVFAPDGTETPATEEEWSKKVIKTAREGNPKNLSTDVAKVASAPGRVGGAVVGNLLAPPLALLGAASDVPSVMRGEQTWDDVNRNMAKTHEGVVESAKEIGVSITTDPLSLFSIGLRGPSAAARASVLGSRSLGLDKAAATRLADDVGMVMSRAGGTTQAAPEVIAAFERHGSTADAARKLWGPNLEFLGRGQAEAHLPFMSGMSVPIDTQYRARKALQSVADPLLQRAGRRGLFDPTLEHAENAVRAARGKANVLEEQSTAELEQMMRGLPEGNRLADPKVREQVYTRHIRPDFTREKYTPPKDTGSIDLLAPEADDPFAAGAKLVEHNGEQWLLRPNGDYVPFDKLDEVFGPGTKQYISGLERSGEQWRQQLVGAGYLTPEQSAADPISGMYMRRPMTSVSGPLEHTVARNQRAASEGTSIRQSRVDDFPGGLSRSDVERAGYMKEKSVDPNKITAEYGHMAARAKAETDLKRQIMEQFGREPGVGSGSALNAKTKRMTLKLDDGTELTRDVPADVADLFEGAFAPTLDKMNKVARQVFRGGNPATAAMLAVLDKLDWLNARWKGLVLKSPGYNAVNVFNDTMWMAIDGNKQAPQFIALADEFIRNPKQAVQLGRLNMSAGDLIEEAARQGLPVRVAGGARFDQDNTTTFFGEAPRGPVDRYQRALEPKGFTAKKALRAVAPAEFGGTRVAQGVADSIEARTKLAHYVWRRSMGDSPAEAARRTSSVLIDYGDRSRGQQVLGTLIPFAKFMTAAPGRAIRTAGKNPGGALLVDRTLEQLSDDEQPVPEYLGERGRPVVLSGQPERVARNVAREMSNAVGHLPFAQKFEQSATGIPESSRVGMLPRLDIYESFKPITELAQGNIDPLVNSMRPEIKIGMELASERDMMSKRDMERPSLPGMFARGSDIFPQALQANAGAMPWFSKNVPPYLVGRGELTLANQILGLRQPGADFQQLGGGRHYVDNQDPRNIYGLQWLPYFTGASLYGIDPATNLANMVNKAKFRAAEAAAKEAGKGDKMEQRRQSR